MTDIEQWLAGRISVRPTELAKATGMSHQDIRRKVRDNQIPRMPNTGKSICIPAWTVRAWAATGDWQHPDYQPNATVPAAATAGT